MSTVAVLILCLLFNAISLSICRDKTFYIKPTDSSHCPGTFLSPCLTLDEFSSHKLHTKSFEELFLPSFTLIFLPGNHTSCASIDFMNVDSVIMTGMSSLSDFDVKNPQVVIDLICNDIQIHSGLNISYLAINGRGRFSVIVQDVLKKVSIDLHQVKLISSALLIKSGHDMVVNISWVLFTASKINVNSTFVANVSITDSVFLSGNQPQTLAFCHKGLHHSVHLINLLKFMSSSVHVLQVIVDNVTVLDLPQNNTYLKPLGHNSSFCDTNDSQLDSGNDFAVLLQPSSKLHLRITLVSISITNSNFNHDQKNGTAIVLELLQSSHIRIANTTISGYTQGAIVSLNHWMSIDFGLYNVSVIGNSLSMPVMEDLEMNAGAGLTIYNYIHNLRDPMYYEISNCVFESNIDNQEMSEIVLLYGMHSININNSTFSNNHGTSISAHDSKFSLNGFAEFKNNVARSGGALALYTSTLKLTVPTKIYIYNNSATKFGGGIYVDNLSFDFVTNINRPCFYHSELGVTLSTFHIHFENNFAREGGDNIYGAQVGGRCMVNALDYNVKSIFTFVPNNTLSVVSSRATRVCLCDSGGNRPLCADKSKVFVTNMTAYPGESFHIHAITVGADLGTTTGNVYAKILPSPNGSLTGSLGQRHYEYQQVNSKDHCTTLSYSILSRSNYEVLYLVSTNASYRRDYYYRSVDTAIEEYTRDDMISTVLLTTPIFINITLKRCPPGFIMTGNNYCDCYDELFSYNIRCTFQDGVGQITREGNIWIGVHVDENQIIFNDKCPSEYCKQESVAVRMEGVVNESDSQCAFNHAGILCGGCETGYSLSLGSTHCLYCPGSSAYAALVAFLFGGLILIGIILFLELVIVNGGINSLIFYANIIWAYKSLIFPHSDANINNVLLKVIKYFFKIFIATLNLDVGFDICFWDGMDAFWKSIIQFAFPVYIWMIAGVAVAVMPCCKRCLQRCASCKCVQHPVKVLVTLILMSYAKLIRTILGVFTFSILKTYPANTTEKVWSLDGNVSYLRGKHIVLFVIALVALFLALIYTIFISAVGLKDYINRKLILKKCTKILDMPLPLYDAHFASFKKNHKYWLGLLLFVRAVLLVVFSSTLGISPVVNLPILILVITLLLFWMGWKEIYKEKCMWFQQGLSLSNLIAISGGILYTELANKELLKSIFVCISVGIALFQFAGIVGKSIIQYCIKCANCSCNTGADGLHEPLLDNYSDNDTESET